MKTVQAVKLLLEEYRQHVERIVATTKKDYDKQVCAAYDDTITKLKKLYLLFPDILSFGDMDSLTEGEMRSLIETISKRVSQKYSAKLLPSGKMLRDDVCGTEFTTPAFIAWQGAASKEANFVIRYTKDTFGPAVLAMNYLVSNMLLSLPIGSVHLNFVDLNFSGGAQLFTKNLDKSLFRDLIVDSNQLNDFCKEMQQRMVTILQECGNLAEYNEQNHTILYPYEVVVLLDYPNMYDYAAQQLASLFENGYKGGIYFVVLHNTDQEAVPGMKSLVDMKEHYSDDIKIFRKTSSGVVSHVSCLEKGLQGELLFNYINAAAKHKPAAKVLKTDVVKLYQQPYMDTNSIIEVPIGEMSNGSKVNFLMNTIDHIHCFILGQSGSGKSVFLHNIIQGAMFKYRPEDLQFYLLDFKLGGVEFNRYRDAKHVKALLVDNSDMQITLEILRDLNEQMKERGKTLRAAGVSNIADYNKTNPRNRMPKILFVADECHAMFSTSVGSDTKLFREMSEILVRIAKEGRSQGVHLVLATQTLAQTDISNEIINNISDRYLLKCASTDSEKMIEGSSKMTANLATGQIYYRFKDVQESLFQSYLTTNDEVPRVMKYITSKAKDCASNGQFYFNGSQIYEIDQQLIDALPSQRNNVAALGCSLDLKREPVRIALKDDDGENILFFGINDQEQVTRIVMNALTTLVLSAKSRRRTLKTCVIDTLGFDDGRHVGVLSELQTNGFIDKVLSENKKIGPELYKIAKGIMNETMEPTLLVILGQERIRGLRLNQDIECSEQIAVNANANANGKGNAEFASLMSTDFGGCTGGGKPDADISSYRKALSYILDNGPQVGVHTLLQVDVPSKLLYTDDYVNAKYVFNKFNHLVMSRSEESAAIALGLRDDIRLDRLSSDEERLRAVYYASDRDAYQMFTPYVQNN